MIKEYKLSYSNDEPSDLIMLKSDDSSKTWRVYFDTRELEDKREVYEVTVPTTTTEKETVKDEVTGETKEVEVEKTTYTTKKVTRKTYESKYFDVVKQKDIEVTSLSLVKEELLAELNKYDSGTEVNSFIINGASYWLDKSTRVGLMNSTSIQKSAGYEKTVLWMGSTPLTINCDLVIKLLAGLEIYALDCFNKTAEHRKNISALVSLSDAISYDYTAGYPDKLTINI